jgi:aryl-alcohol dehydrogenase-like predicted oxidoreductase
VENRRKVSLMLEELRRVAANLNMTLPQLVISWTVSHPTITHVLCGARNAKYANENAVGGYGWVNDSTLEVVDAILDRHKLKIPHPFLPDE